MDREEIRMLAEQGEDAGVQIYIGGVSAGLLNSMITEYENDSMPYAYGDTGGEFQEGVLTGIEKFFNLVEYSPSRKRIER